MIRRLKQDPAGLSGLQILMDEMLCEGEILVNRQLLADVGGLNPYLRAKQKYELLIRLAFEEPFLLVEEEMEPGEMDILLTDDEPEMTDAYGFQTDCYVTGCYSHQLQEAAVFDEVITAIATEAQMAGREAQTIAFLEQMLKRGDAYWNIAEGSCPILVYCGDDICHNVLNIFADQFGEALAQTGKKVIYFDCSQNDAGELTQYMHRHFQAIIGVQSWLFSVKMADGIHYLHEYLHGPKYNFIFDHPVWMLQHMKQRYDDFYILTHDNNYVSFTERYYQHKAILFPPAGMESQKKVQEKRIYDLTFIGTYGDYWNEVRRIHQMDRKKRFLANQFLLEMRKNPTDTAEEALNTVLKRRGMELPDQEFLEMLYEFRRVIYCVMHYYRDRVLREILESGIRLDVFGDSWSTCPLTCYPNLICHPNVTVEESLEIWKQSKLSLNIMSWHKGGFTERMANIMLAGAVLVTDDTTYLEGTYTKEELVSFPLAERKMLPQKIQMLLYDDEKRLEIAWRGREKTMREHTWKRRAEQFQEILMERWTNEKSECDRTML